MMKPVAVVLGVIAILFISVVAFAQEAAPPPIAQQAEIIPLKVSRQQLMLIGQGLQELPAKLANPLLNELQAQLNAVDKAVADANQKAAEETRKALAEKAAVEKSPELAAQKP